MSKEDEALKLALEKIAGALPAYIDGVAAREYLATIHKAMAEQPAQQKPVQQDAAALFREALAFGLAYGPALAADQWEEERALKVAQLVSRLAAPQPAPVQQETVAQWQLRHHLHTDGIWENCTESDAAVMQKEAPTFEIRRLYTSPQPAQRTADTKRLDALAENSWDLRCFSMSDDDIGWRVIEHHMEKPHERTVAEVYRDDPRQAIDEAIEAAHGIKENT